MEQALFYTMILAAAELIEAFIQRAPTLLGVLQKLYIYYRRNVFLFFLIQPGFYILLFIVLSTGVLNATMIFLIALKVFDIFYKIELIKEVFIKQELSGESIQILQWKIPSYFWLLAVCVYPPLLYLALS